MSKLVLNDVTNINALSVINDNFDKIELEFQNKVLYRNNPVGEPNQMQNTLDMNGQRVMNLPEPISSSEAARLQDVQNAISGNSTANLVAFTPTGDISATNVQSAIVEVDTEMHAADALKVNIADLSNTSNVALGDALMGVKSTLTGGTARTQHDKNADIVSIKDFGAVGDGVTDDSIAVANALAASLHVVVPSGMTPLISSQLTVQNHGKLQFLGGPGNTTSSYPASYFIKKSTMTSAAILLGECSSIEGGGLVCQVGNTGDGIEIRGNSAKVRHFLVHAAGGNGVRIGRDGLTGGNYNSYELTHVVSQSNGGHGFYIHDGKTDTVNGANANAGTLTQCFSHDNAGDGFRLGFCWWVTLLNCLSESNTGWGLNLIGTDIQTYPSCRWATVIGGDYNEGNAAGIISDPAYFSIFVLPDTNQHPSTASNGLQGSAARTIIGGTSGRVRGLTIYDALLDLTVGQIKFPATQSASADVNTLDDYEEGQTAAWTPAQSGVSLTIGEARYIKIGRYVWFTFDITWPSTADATAVTITGLPFTPIGSNAGSFNAGFTSYANYITGVVGSGGLSLYGAGGNPSTQLTNANLSTRRIIGSGWYLANA